MRQKAPKGLFRNILNRLDPQGRVLRLRVFRVVRAAVAVQMGGAERTRTMPVQRRFPGIQLFGRQRITLARLLIRQHAILYGLDNGQFSRFYPSLCRRRGEKRNSRAVTVHLFRHEHTRYFL